MPAPTKTPHSATNLVAVILDPGTWRAREAAHRARLEKYVAPHLERRARGVKHPVHDFLFTYYSHRPSALLRWHPGYGVDLEDGPAGASADDVQAAHELISSTRRLLEATASRPPTLGCFGLHEWAMLYRADEVRHRWPLRLGAQQTDDVVESHRIGCSHFDAFRFFTPPARPLNTLNPGREDRSAFEQPGCLHAGMDLYGKVAVRLSPLIPSELVADAFELAWDIRILDMRAAPYDLTGLVLDPSGEEWSPIPIETPDGKQAYVAAQRQFTQRGVPVRAALIRECERLLAHRSGTNR